MNHVARFLVDLDRRWSPPGGSVVLHRMLTGRNPFIGTNPAELVAQISRRAAPRLRDAPDLPREAAALLQTILDRAMDKEPAARYASAAHCTTLRVCARISNYISNRARHLWPSACPLRS